MPINIKVCPSFSFSICLTICLAISSSVFSQNYKIEKEDTWIKPLTHRAKSKINKYDVSWGYYTLLSDYQFNLDKNASYYHDVVSVVSYSGITKVSQLSVNYDTSYQKLKIHHLYVWRNGQKLDRTSTLTFNNLNNEYQLENGIYTGLVTAYCNLVDIRKDDLIDFSYTIIGKNPILAEGKYLFLPLESANMIDQLNVKILYSKDKSYAYKCYGCDSTSSVQSSMNGNFTELLIQQENLKPSSFNSWKEVDLWAQGVFSLKKQPDLSEVFNEVLNGSESRDEKINKLIDYVQDDIRYMGIEAGIGSLKPFHPNQVVKQRFGDCKDKSLLLVSLLKMIGVEKAYPVLVNSYLKHTLNTLYPSNEVFNHCIVRFELNDSIYWVDPTHTQQGGNYKTFSLSDYGLGLVVGLNSNSLTEIKVNYDNTLVEIQDEFTMTSFTDEVVYLGSSRRSGLEADVRRLGFEHFSLEDFTKLFLDDMKLYYPDVRESNPIKLEDNIEENVFTTTYNYYLNGLWTDGDKAKIEGLSNVWFHKFEPFTIYQEINESTCLDRKYEYALNYPTNFVYKVKLHLPKDVLVLDRYSQVENEAFYFDEKIEQIKSNSFQITYKYKVKVPSISAELYKKVCEDKNTIAKNLPIVIFFKK
jgi:transglutaminase-like putative cysteine protease